MAAVTELRVVNGSDEDQDVYLTLGSYPDGYVSDVRGIFGIQSSGLQGSFPMSPGETKSYVSPVGLAFSGNLSFGTPPLNCPTPDLPNGVNIFEFTLNNSGQDVQNPQETVDISCVAGVHCLLRVNLDGGGEWNDGTGIDIVTFSNSTLRENHGRAGVYPYGCDKCTEIDDPPECPGPTPHYDTPQEEPICNVQRDAAKSGGYVEVHFLEEV